MNFYIIGPVTGREDRNIKAFEKAREKVLGLFEWDEVAIPHDFVDEDATHDQAMRLCIDHVVNKTDCVVTLIDWYRSEGAKEEYAAADACGIPCIGLNVLENVMDIVHVSDSYVHHVPTMDVCEGD